jgi:lipoprotein-releasing system ATP-binding protein
VIKAVNIHKSFGSLEVLKGIDVEFAEAEVVALVGTSGAGKSTLLHILGTLMRPDKGEVIIKDVNMGQLKDKQLAHFRNQHIGFVFQFHNLLPEFSALENVCMPAFVSGTTRKVAETRARELLEFLNLADRISHKPSELSGGEQQRVAVARALMNKPSVIFADEPSGNLDSQNKKELHELFFSLRDQFRQTIVVVTHDNGLATMADRTLTMRDGKMLTQ